MKSRKNPSVLPMALPGHPDVPISPPALPICPPITLALRIEPAQEDQVKNDRSEINAVEELLEKLEELLMPAFTFFVGEPALLTTCPINRSSNTIF